jgi:hypothetical protein
MWTRERTCQQSQTWKQKVVWSYNHGIQHIIENKPRRSYYLTKSGNAHAIDFKKLQFFFLEPSKSQRQATCLLHLNP